MAFCKNCGRNLNPDEKFCPGCGAPVGGAEEQCFSTGTDSNTGAGNSGNTGYSGDRTAEYDPGDIEANKVVCGISYLGILFFLPLIACPNSRFGKFHANQALLVLILMVAGGFIANVIGMICGAFWAIPALGAIMNVVSGVVSAVCGIVPFAAFIFGLVNALCGKAAELPIIGKINLINK
ncbi:MAG: zinc-ribbon domain-containing protein [Ruminiclostridium sp.]